ncbi:hypothetical protein ACIBCH_41920 [Amycolatopsis thailandensis]|uniref:hypothetical protein n=1 Tax=Amycolatopsis thailandensis TaxID=589330 RepID=UPI0037A5737A
MIALAVATGIAPRYLEELDERSIITMAWMVDQQHKQASGKASGTGEVPSRYGSAQMSG